MSKELPEHVLFQCKLLCEYCSKYEAEYNGFEFIHCIETNNTSSSIDFSWKRQNKPNSEIRFIFSEVKKCDASKIRERSTIYKQYIYK